MVSEIKSTESDQQVSNYKILTYLVDKKLKIIYAFQTHEISELGI
jgi:hypothetical protein